MTYIFEYLKIFSKIINERLTSLILKMLELSFSFDYVMNVFRMNLNFGYKLRK